MIDLKYGDGNITMVTSIEDSLGGVYLLSKRINPLENLMNNGYLAERDKYHSATYLEGVANTFEETLWHARKSTREE